MTKKKEPYAFTYALGPPPPSKTIEMSAETEAFLKRLAKEDYLYRLANEVKQGPDIPDILDRAAWWLPANDEDPRCLEDEDWLLALACIDETGDKAPLVALLKSDVPLPSIPREWIADLLDRYELSRKRGKPRVPIYDRSESETALIKAKRCYAEARQDGLGQEAAVKWAAKQWGLPVATVRNAVQGRRGSSRRRR
jgi:hypothetical protein